ncbi:NECA1 protein, partial [Semnornis frantzii]|nr:NECA1 protein [Semnornis frantzii]
ACAELLAVCLLSADRGPAPRRQPLPIFHDVNADDGKLSFEEFKNYFADGILSSEELWELFSAIDRRHSDNVDTEKLCGKFGDVPALEGFLLRVCGGALCLSDLGSQVALTVSVPECQHRKYESSSKLEQFLTRFLLRETLQQLQSLQGSLECAVDTVEEQAGRERKEVQKPEASLGLRPGRRCGRRGQKNVCLSPTDPYSGMLTTGSCCLAATALLGASCPAGACGGCGSSSVAQEPSCPAARWSSWGRLSKPWGLMAPMWPHSAQCHSCPCSVSACKLTDEACFILYEFWQDVTSWR